MASSSHPLQRGEAALVPQVQREGAKLETRGDCQVSVWILVSGPWVGSKKGPEVDPPNEAFSSQGKGRTPFLTGEEKGVGTPLPIFQVRPEAQRTKATF